MASMHCSGLLCTLPVQEYELQHERLDRQGLRTPVISKEEFQLSRSSTHKQHDDVKEVLQCKVKVHDKEVHATWKAMHAHHASQALLLLIHQLNYRLHKRFFSL
jgi:hypothetical protein